MTQVKVYRISGEMLISHDHFPKWQKFNLELTGTSEKDAINKTYSLLGSKHKLRRFHIKINKVEEVANKEAVSKNIQDLLAIDRWNI
ncbi:50S ribosomal protein L18a [Fervidicoccus fontis]|jgi:large subunit ribosomal protein LX|uniref:Large ribosomal subunit protein eL20 n=2 Tax=Fervidicoccus fontis TaxID=683846 RepID=I0A2P3_FERFK|nr:50S ribosomal protein L18Ae [Fervidicoccus fontis]AFH43250.1 50S ribosomal protein LX [Fervidicoccus fontis Kam940]MBE9390629.1 50S ribosomal protein L18a [Fervidicoccus fontis]PMB75781.1 MAG: 50S ribosomal protein L18a [Fervidicoccus fontis]PMB76500.1 MAG: 50S ribosomal protein L18a [Fervidicoccus fontis]HEW63457.1 50S ribosomal protein L18a [Fervidicoccus fontis]